MEIARKEFKTNHSETINIYFLGDIHEGNSNCDREALKKAVKIIQDDPMGYWVGMGDYIEAITIHDKRFDPVAIAKEYDIRDLEDLPYRQIERVFSYLAPIKEKCIGLLMGNHEEKYVKYNSSNVFRRFWELFGNSELPRLGYVGYLKLAFYFEGKSTADKTVTVALNHGDGGSGYLEGYPVNKVHQIFRWSRADVNICGHLHKLVEDMKLTQGNITQNDQHFEKPQFFGMSGCFLRTYVEGQRNYFEHKGRSASDIGMLRLSIKCVRPLQMRLFKMYM